MLLRHGRGSMPQKERFFEMFNFYRHEESMEQLSLFDSSAQNEHERAANRAAKLRREIEHHNKLYHQLDAPEITAFIKDFLFLFIK